MKKNEPKQNFKLTELRIDSELKEKIDKAIKVLNENGLIEINITNFRKMALIQFTKEILAGNFEFGFSVQTNTTNKDK